MVNGASVLQGYYRAQEKGIRTSIYRIHDKLTGLYNRAFFEEEVKRLDNSRQYPHSFIIADINGLKFTNDAFGHEIGDNILKEFTDTLRTCLRKDDI